MNALLSFPANDIRVDGLALDVELPTDWLQKKLKGSEITGDGPGMWGRIKGRLSRSGISDIVVRTRVLCGVSIACVRCLEPAPIAIDAELSLLLQPASRSETRRKDPSKTDGEYEFKSAEADLDTYDGETVVLDEFVRELIMLEVPSFPLCRDDCPGIAADKAEVPKGSDPRLAPLSSFSKNKGPVTVSDLMDAAVERSAALRSGGRRKPILRRNHKSGKKK